MGLGQRHAERLCLGDWPHVTLLASGLPVLPAGRPICDSYNAASWAGFSPIQIKSVTFGNNSAPTNWAVVSDFGGNAEINQDCTSFGGPFCIYPWFSLGTSGFHYGVDYPDNVTDFGQGAQFATTTQCDSAAFGPNSLYCAQIVH